MEMLDTSYSMYTYYVHNIYMYMYVQYVYTESMQTVF